ncbi:MAG TPA: glycoside hydrolase family 30 beta sandwich domain-containing protein [Polyangia bacterium]
MASLLSTLTPAALAGCGSNAPPPDVGMPLPTAATVTVDPATVHQTMVGFGAAVAYYAGSATVNPMSAQLMQALFGDLGIQILRVGNWYNNNNDANGSFMQTAAFVQAVHQAGYSPILLMSSWNPPLALKDNDNLRMGGTLPKNADGTYQYAQFAAWWAESLTAFQTASGGIVPDVISIQNEPDFTTNNEGTCLFDPTETAIHAGYGQALDAVKTALAGTAGLPMPKLAGPENDSLNKNETPRYISGITSSGYLDDLDIVAHHLYGGTDSAPNMFDGNMMGVTAAAAGKPIWQTEYGPNAENFFYTAWLIQNAVTVEGVSAYLYWDLYWVPQSTPSGLVSVSTTGYTVNDDYYAVQHFAKLTGTGWTRVDSSATESVITSSAFLSPDGTQLTLVLVNTDAADHQITIAPGSFAGTTSAVYRSSGTTERYAAIGPLDAAGSLDMPPRSVATVTLGP